MSAAHLVIIKLSQKGNPLNPPGSAPGTAVTVVCLQGYKAAEILPIHFSALFLMIAGLKSSETIEVASTCRYTSGPNFV